MDTEELKQEEIATEEWKQQEVTSEELEQQEVVTEELKQQEVATEELLEQENQKPSESKLPMKYLMAIVAVCIAIAVVVSFDNSNTSAQEMRLEKYIGLVTLQNNSKQKELVEGSRLVTQDTIETFVESNAYISLDNTKALKVDQDSQIEIIQVNNNLDIELYKGSLYFNVSEPLIEDETLEFHTNNIVTGVRGTSGVITYAEDVYQSQVVVLSGTVEVMTTEAEPQVVAVRQGEVAVATTLADGTVQLEVREQEDTPSYLFATNFLDDLGEGVEEYVEKVVEEVVEEEVEEDYIIQWVDADFERGFRSPNFEGIEPIVGDVWASEVANTKMLIMQNTSIILNSGINVIEDVVHFKNLTSLHLLNNNISDISALSGLTKLKTLCLEGNNISDISALSGLTNLEELYLSGNNISDISALSGLTNLRTLDLGVIPSHAGFTDREAILSDYELNNKGNNISDISALSGLTNLLDLNLNDNNISDISALSGLTNLLFLNLNDNNISDISALSGLNLDMLYLLNNNISDWSPVEHVRIVVGKP